MKPSTAEAADKGAHPRKRRVAGGGPVGNRAGSCCSPDRSSGTGIQAAGAVALLAPCEPLQSVRSAAFGPLASSRLAGEPALGRLSWWWTV